MAKESFILYQDYGDIINKLSDEQAGKLFKMIFEYEKTGEYPECDLVLDIAFTQIKNNLDRNKKKYTEKCERNREIAKQRWNKRTDANGYERTPSDADNDLDPDLVNENDNEKESLEFSFEAFKSKYPTASSGNKPGMSRALKVFSESVNGKRTRIFKALENYANSDQAKKGFVMDAEKFLKTDWNEWEHLESGGNGKPKTDKEIKYYWAEP